MFCNNCGNQVQDGQMFCSMCGEKIIQYNFNGEKSENSNNQNTVKNNYFQKPDNDFFLNSVNQSSNNQVDMSQGNTYYNQNATMPQENAYYNQNASMNQENAYYNQNALINHESDFIDKSNRKNNIKKSDNTKGVFSKKKKTIIFCSVISLVLILSFIGFIVVKKIMTNVYYKKGCDEYEKLMELSDQGRDFKTNFQEVSLRSYLDDIEYYFKKCNYKKGDIEYEFASNAYMVLSIYIERYYEKGPLDYSLETWQSYLQELDDIKTNDKKLNKFVDIMESQCNAAIDFYNFDFKKSYDDISWCKDYVSYFYDELYCYSYGIKLMYMDDTIYSVINNSLQVKNFEIFTGDASDYIKYEEGYPIVICQFENSSSYDYYWSFSDGYYSKKTLTSELAYGISRREYGFNSGTRRKLPLYYDINDGVIEQICSHISDGTITFLDIYK